MMKLALEFTLEWFEDFTQSNNGEEYDGENICICSEKKYSAGFSDWPGYYVVITLNKHILDLANRASEDSKNKTRESLKEAIDKAIKDPHALGGKFYLYLDKGAFDIAD